MEIKEKSITFEKWFSESSVYVLEKLRSNSNGLSRDEAALRLKNYGPNRLPDAKVDSFFIIFLRQFKSPLIYVLLAAGLVIFFLEGIIDAAVIIFVLMFNAVVGTVQEGRAQNTLLALKKFVETKAAVLRQGEEIIVPEKEIVPGDILILQEGDKIPADARIIYSSAFKVDEAALTGESGPVQKSPEPLGKSNLPTSEQKNMVFMGTNIVAGNARAVAVNTGTDTVIGKIAGEIAAIDTEIPLKTNIRHLSRLIIITVAGISSVLFLLGIALGNTAKDMLATAVALSVSIIPEGLPVVITLVLATGVWRMTKRNTLVKKLQAVEALGQAQIIAVDKTGTITKNELVIQEAHVNGKFFQVEGIGYNPEGKISLEGEEINPMEHPGLYLLGSGAAFCANARAMLSKKDKKWKVRGDPTEAALLIFAGKMGFKKEDLVQKSPLIAEIPFDYKTKYHATVHGMDGEGSLTVIGAPEMILKLSRYEWHPDGDQALSDDKKNELKGVFESMSRKGLRVLALGIKNKVSKNISLDKVEGLTFVGFYGMKDALRPEVHGAMERAVNAGIRIVMITGDHKITAQAIAKEAGIYKDNDGVLTGEELEKMSEADLIDKLPYISVFARVTPEHKLKIINAFRARKQIVAMTGDGVNDAPSLVAADLGVAMGGIGTEVAKEAADIILLDDNFGSIISAIEEGRSIYKTIKKVILYLFSTSIGEVLTITAAVILGFPLPLLAVQIIWLNLVTDGFLTVAMGMEPKEKGLLRGNFEHPKKYIVDKLMAQRMLIMALAMMLGTIFLFKDYFENDIVKAWTISLTTLAVFQWFNAWNCRSESKSIFQMNPLANKFLLGATLIVVNLQLIAVYNPFFQKILRTAPLEFSEWLIIIPIAGSIIAAEEVRKFFFRRRLRKIQV